MEFQNGTSQIYKTTEQRWIIGGYTADHTIEEYVDTQIHGYTCDYDEKKLETMQNDTLRSETVKGKGTIRGNTYYEDNCKTICKLNSTILYFKAHYYKLEFKYIA